MDAFPRYGEILKIAENKTGRCSEWSMLFGAILSSLGIKTRIVHDFLDHCWNEAMLTHNYKHPENRHVCPILVVLLIPSSFVARFNIC